MDSKNSCKTFIMMDVLKHFTNEWSELWLAFVMEKLHTDAIIRHHEMCAIGQNKNLMMDVVEKHIKTIKWDFRCLSGNPNLTFAFIKKYNRRNWNKSIIVRNIAFSIDDIMQNTELHAKYGDLSHNPNLTIDHVLQNPNVKWNWYALAKHPNMTVDVILNNPDLPWYSPCGECCMCMCSLNDVKKLRTCIFRGICKNQSLTIDFIRNHLIPKENITIQCWTDMSKCKNITINDIIQNPDMPFVIQYNPNFSYNPDLLVVGVNDIESHGYYIYHISANPCTTMKIIIDNPHEPWDYMQISKNPNLTMKMLRDHPNELWDWYHVIKQPFDEDRNTFIEYHVKWLLLLMIYDGYCVMDWSKKRMRVENVDLVLANDYLVKKVMGY